MKTLFIATVLWFAEDDPISAERQCKAVVVCEARAQSCDVLVWGACEMPIESCLESQVRHARGTVDTLGCAPHARELVIDRPRK